MIQKSTVQKRGWNIYVQGTVRRNGKRESVKLWRNVTGCVNNKQQPGHLWIQADRTGHMCMVERLESEMQKICAPREVRLLIAFLRSSIFVQRTGVTVILPLWHVYLVSDRRCQKK